MCRKKNEKVLKKVCRWGWGIGGQQSGFAGGLFDLKPNLLKICFQTKISPLMSQFTFHQKLLNKTSGLQEGYQELLLAWPCKGIWKLYFEHSVTLQRCLTILKPENPRSLVL